MDTKASTLDPALLHLVTEMNLFGTVYSCNTVAPVMKQQHSGKIITVSSVAGTAPSADGGYAHYGAAKAAIAELPEGLSSLGSAFRVMRRERSVGSAMLPTKPGAAEPSPRDPGSLGAAEPSPRNPG
jgi:NADP-dependent 3-hydroxy acid dehydrogenase YdfG